MHAPSVTLAGALFLVLAHSAAAHEFTSKGVTVAHPWARATPGGVKVGGAYFEMKAAAGKGDRLIAASSPVAGSVEMHSNTMDGGVARMRRVDAIPVAGGSSVVLGPSGYHVMLMDLKQPLKEGDLLKLTLVFEKAGPIEVEATVEPVGALGPHGFDHQPGAAPADASKPGTREHKH
jgi:copper(I)-binding protein